MTAERPNTRKSMSVKNQNNQKIIYEQKIKLSKTTTEIEERT